MNRIFITGALLTLAAGGGLIFDTLYPPQLAFVVPPEVGALANEQTGGPTRIIIPDLAINIPIVPGIIKNNIWSVADDTANHLVTSAHPGEASNIVVYGHDDSDLFGPLKEAKVNQIVTLLDSNREPRDYQIEKITIVSPQDVSVVQPTDHETLTVYTCVGFANSRRLVIQARPLSAPASAADHSS